MPGGSAATAAVGGATGAVSMPAVGAADARVGAADARVGAADAKAGAADAAITAAASVGGALLVCAFVLSTDFLADGFASFEPGFVFVPLPTGDLVAAGDVAACGCCTGVVAVAIVLGLEALLYIVVTARRLNVWPVDYVRVIWRPVLATGCMCAAVLLGGHDWTEAVQETGALVLHAVLTAALGAAVYGATLIGSWLAAGRPDGPEAILLRFAGKLLPDRLRPH